MRTPRSGLPPSTRCPALCPRGRSGQQAGAHLHRGRLLIRASPGAVVPPADYPEELTVRAPEGMDRADEFGPPLRRSARRGSEGPQERLGQRWSPHTGRRRLKGPWRSIDGLRHHASSAGAEWMDRLGASGRSSDSATGEGDREVRRIPLNSDCAPPASRRPAALRTSTGRRRSPWTAGCWTPCSPYSSCDLHAQRGWDRQVWARLAHEVRAGWRRLLQAFRNVEHRESADLAN